MSSRVDGLAACAVFGMKCETGAMRSGQGKGVTTVEKKRHQIGS